MKHDSRRVNNRSRRDLLKSFAVALAVSIAGLARRADATEEAIIDNPAGGHRFIRGIY